MTIRDAMDRRVRFWKREMPHEILANVGAKRPEAGPSKWERYVRQKGLETLCSYDRPPVFEDLEALFEQYEARLGDPFDPDAEKEVHDDSFAVPIFCPTVHFGEGIVGTFFGGEPIFASTDIKTESVCRPVVKDWSQLDSLRFDESSTWLQRILDCHRFFMARSRGRFAVQPYCTIDALNFVVVMRGDTQAFMDVVTDVPEARRLMEIGLDTAVRYWNLQREIVEENSRRAIKHDEYAQLCPGHAGPGLSVDAYGLCHESVYEDVGLDYTQRLIDALGGGFLHVHSNGSHLLPIVGKLKGLTELNPSDDPRHERYFPRIRQVRDCTGDVPIRVACTLDELTAGLRDGTLPGGVHFTVQGALGSVGEANRLMDKVRSYRA